MKYVLDEKDILSAVIAYLAKEKGIELSGKVDWTVVVTPGRVGERGAIQIGVEMLDEEERKNGR